MSYSEELQLQKPFTHQDILAKVEKGKPAPYSIPRGLVEATDGGCYAYLSEGTMALIAIPAEGGIPQEGLKDDRTFEGWRKEK